MIYFNVMSPFNNKFESLMGNLIFNWERNLINSIRAIDLTIHLEHPIIFSNSNVEPYRYVLAIEDRKIPYNMRLTPAWNL